MSAVSDRVLSLLGHLRVDPESDAILEGLVSALCGPLERASLVAHGDEGLRPWQAITDPALAPEWALPYAAQWTGGRMPPRRRGESADAYLERARREVVYPRGMRRGSARAVLEVVRDHLAGDRSVIFRERFGGDPWLLMVVTKPSETPDPEVMAAAAQRVVPAGIVLRLENRSTRDWEEVRTTWATWGDVLTDNASWREVLEVPET